MIEINLFDDSFPAQACSVPLQTPQTMRYVRRQTDWNGITVFTGRVMFDAVVDDVRSRFKVGWLNGDERCLRPDFYDAAPDVAHKFDAIMTHDAELLALGRPFVKTIRGGSWVPLDQWCLPPKTKNVSMILSDKTTLPGHQLRHAIAAAGLPIDLYGPGYTPIGYEKSIAYRDYRYAVVVEACKAENWFTEHLIDALAFGCVPFYWGCPNIGEYFDAPGMWQFSMLGSLAWMFERGYIEREGYSHLQDAIAECQQNARAYAITEDWQIAHCLRPFVEAL